MKTVLNYGVFSRNRGIIFLLLLFLSVTLLQSRTLPALESSDLGLHINYALHLRESGQLPDRSLAATNPTRQTSGQPPLVYMIGALWLQVLNAPQIDDEQLYNHTDAIVRNRWFQPHNVWARWDNLTVLLHGRDEEAFGWPDLVLVSWYLGVISSIYGALAVAAMYLAAGEIFASRKWQLTATAVFAFFPTMLHISSYFNNDAPAVAFATLTLWLALRMIRTGASWQLCVLAGVFLTLGALSKVNSLAAGAAIALALIYDWRTRERSFQQSFAFVLSVSLPLVLFGVWVLWGVVNFGDPLGLNTHQLPTESVYAATRTLPELLAQFPHLYLSYWGWFKFTYLHPVTYTAFGLVLVLGVWGLLYGLRRRFSKPKYMQVVIISVVLGITFVAMIRWMQQLNFTGGRLMYPSHASVAILLTGGLYLLAKQFPGRANGIRVFGAGTMMCLGTFGPFFAIAESFYPPPMLSRERLPALTGAPVTFDGTIRLLGIAQPTRMFDAADRSYDAYPVTACWEVLRETDVPAAFSLKLIRDGVIVADRTSLFGVGRYPSVSWRAGDIFCDEVHFWLDDPDSADDPLPQAGLTYDIAAVVLNAETLAVDWPAVNDAGESVAVPILGQAASRAGTMPLPGDLPALPEPVAFADLARLTHADVQGDVLRLGWQVTGTTPESWTGFVHLYDGAGNFIASVGDGPPLNGAYPTWAWSAGEVLSETRMLSLPPDLPPGEYQVQVGFYRADTGERMPVSMSGADMPSRSAPVTGLLVD